MFRNFTLRHRHTHAAVLIRNSVTLADYFALAVGQLLAKPIYKTFRQFNLINVFKYSPECVAVGHAVREFKKFA